jgi:hypothetical protein
VLGFIKAPEKSFIALEYAEKGDMKQFLYTFLCLLISNAGFFCYYFALLISFNLSFSQQNHLDFFAKISLLFGIAKG